MEAWTNSSTGADESPPQGAPSLDPAADQVTPPPEPTALAAANVAVTPPPEAAVPTPQPLTMVSGVIEATRPALPLVTIIPAPEPAPVAEAPRATAAVAAVVAAAPARTGHGGDDSAFEDQIINNWMRQGDRMADPRPVEDLDLLDLAEPTDPVAHELLDSRKPFARPAARAARVGRWISIGALGVAMAFGLYWAAQEPRPGAAAAAATPTVASAADLAPVLAPTAQAPAVAPTPVPATPIVTAEMPSSAATAAHGRHNKHHRGAAVARAHRRHGH